MVIVLLSIQSYALINILKENNYVKEETQTNDELEMEDKNIWSFVPTASADYYPPDNGCFDNMEKSSLKFNSESPWSTMQSPTRHYDSYANYGEQPLRTITDLNGDSLPDLLYINHVRTNPTSSENWLYIRDCIMLNNGNGWDIVYRCKTTPEVHDGNKLRFYGDCALIEEE